jgi:hypothetical protein
MRTDQDEKLGPLNAERFYVWPGISRFDKYPAFMTLSDQILIAFFTACLTLLGGCGLLLLSELFVRPYVAYKSVLGEVTFKLIFYANYISSSLPNADTLKPDADPAKVEAYFAKHLEASNAIREMAARLRAALVAYPFPELVHKLRLIPSPKDIDDAAGLLILISTETMNSYNKDFAIIRDAYAQVAKKLGIPVTL